MCLVINGSAVSTSAISRPPGSTALPGCVVLVPEENLFPEVQLPVGVLTAGLRESVPFATTLPCGDLLTGLAEKLSYLRESDEEGFTLHGTPTLVPMLRSSHSRRPQESSRTRGHATEVRWYAGDRWSSRPDHRGVRLGRSSTPCPPPSPEATRSLACHTPHRPTTGRVFRRPCL